MTRLRRLNAAGIERLEQFLDTCGSQCSLETPINILIDPATSESIGVDVDLEARVFTSRLELGKYLFSALDGNGLSDIDSDRGLWAWIALFYFESLCPPDPRGKRSPGERARWILDAHNFKRYYRHLAAGPYRIVRAYSDCPEIAMCVLCGPPHRPGDAVEQIASRQQLITNRAFMSAATRLYYDSSTGKLRRGAGDKDRGGPRRLATVLQHFDVTFDLYSLSAAELSTLLPKEFDRFNRASR